MLSTKHLKLDLRRYISKEVWLYISENFKEWHISNQNSFEISVFKTIKSIYDYNCNMPIFKTIKVKGESL